MGSRTLASLVVVTLTLIGSASSARAQVALTAPQASRHDDAPLRLSLDELGAPVRETQMDVTLRGDGGRAGRVVAELGLEVLSIGIGTGVGAGLGATDQTPCSGWFCLSPTAVGSVVGGMFGWLLSPAILAAGAGALGGRGDAGGAYLGMLVSVAASALLGVLSATTGSTGLATVTGVLVPLLLLAGPIVGYEMTDENARETARHRQALAWTPTVGVQRDGLTVGVAGQF